MTVKIWKISDIKPYASNPCQNEGMVESVAASICQSGFRQPIIVDKHDGITCGHSRYLAAWQLNLAEVPVHVARS